MSKIFILYFIVYIAAYYFKSWILHKFIIFHVKIYKFWPVWILYFKIMVLIFCKKCQSRFLQHVIFKLRFINHIIGRFVILKNDILNLKIEPQFFKFLYFGVGRFFRKIAEFCWASTTSFKNLRFGPNFLFFQTLCILDNSFKIGITWKRFRSTRFLYFKSDLIFIRFYVSRLKSSVSLIFIFIYVKSIFYFKWVWITLVI